MEINELLQAIHESMIGIAHPRHFANEHAYQAQLFHEMLARLEVRFQRRGLMLEPEHQKTHDAHGLRVRPDLVLHEPFDPARHANRREGNVAVFELKRVASRQEAIGDFESLASMVEQLNYQLAVFINIGSAQSHSAHVPHALRGRLAIFTSSLVDGLAVVSELRI